MLRIDLFFLEKNIIVRVKNSCSSLFQLSKLLFVKNLQTGTKALTFIVTYSVDVKTSQHPISCACKKTEVVHLNAVTPFEVSVKLMSMKVGIIFVSEFSVVHICMPLIIVMGQLIC